MAARKTSKNNAPKSPTKIPAAKAPKAAKVQKAKAPKIPFYAKVGRLFAASSSHELPRGSYARPVNSFAGDVLDQKVRVGTEKVCVFEGSLRDLLETALLRSGIKLKLDGAAIAMPAAPVVKASPAV